MEIINNYSGIVALIVYGLILVLILSLRKKKEVKPETVRTVNTVRTPLDPKDEDAVVACLVAAIECREECHRNVAIRNVRRIA